MYFPTYFFVSFVEINTGQFRLRRSQSWPVLISKKLFGFVFYFILFAFNSSFPAYRRVSLC